GGRINRFSEPGWLIAVRLVLGIPLLAMMVGQPLAPSWFGWAQISMSQHVNAVGLIISITGIWLVHRAFSALGPNISETVLTKESHQLVTSGPYRYVRHPFYLGAFKIVLGLGLLASSLALIVGAIAFVVLFRALIVPLEEAKLEEKLGQDYRRYRETTSSLIPWIV
ncbi:MAG: methyltransferase family protein, partial [Gemmatimonadales bacterium]